MEDFVPFEIAKKLKEKGFREECLLHYTDTGNLFSNSIDTYDRPNQELDYSDFQKCFNNGNSIGLIDVPIISQVLKWLREKKKLHIELWTIGKKPIKWCHTITTLNHVGEKQGWSSGERGDSYEAAAIAGIEYCLENLI